MRKSLIVAISSVLLGVSVSQAGGYQALSTYHMMEAARTGNLDHFNQGIIYQNIDRMEKQRQEERRREEERREQERRAEQRRADDRRLEEQRRASELKNAEIQREQEQIRQQLQQERQQVQNYQVPVQMLKEPRRFSDPVQEAKKKGGTFFWDEGVCKQKLPGGKVEVMPGSAIAIRLCRGKGGPDDIDAAYEQYYARQAALLNKKFAYVDDKTLVQAESCSMWAPTATHLAFDVKCNDKVTLRLFVKSPRLDTPEAKEALETIVEKLSFFSLQTKETSMQTGRGVLFTK